MLSGKKGSIAQKRTKSIISEYVSSHKNDRCYFLRVSIICAENYNENRNAIEAQ